MPFFFTYSHTCSGRIRTQWNQLVRTKGSGSQIQNGKRELFVSPQNKICCEIYVALFCIQVCTLHLIHDSLVGNVVLDFRKKSWHFLAFLTRTDSVIKDASQCGPGSKIVQLLNIYITASSSFKNFCLGKRLTDILKINTFIKLVRCFR